MHPSSFPPRPPQRLLSAPYPAHPVPLPAAAVAALTERFWSISAPVTEEELLRPAGAARCTCCGVQVREAKF